jgi:8-oxo-dGTP diphosphatase
MIKHSVAGIVVVDSLFLVARRIPVGQMGNRWEFPGGKVENNENYETALAREFREEFGFEVKIGELLAETEFTHNKDTIHLHGFQVYFPDPIENLSWILTEHTEVNWVPFSQIPELNFVDSDLKLYEKLRSVYEK